MVQRLAKIVVILMLFISNNDKSVSKDVSVFDCIESLTEDEKKFLESHIHTFDKTQNAVLEETIELSEKNPNEFSWKSHISYAYKWCSYFHIPTIALTHSNPLRA